MSALLSSGNTSTSGFGRLRSLGTLVKENVAISLGLLFVMTIVVTGLLARFPFDPFVPLPADASLPPGSEHWFGTDTNGFDIFSRTIAAGGRDVPLALTGALLALVIGTPLGLLVGRKGRLSSLIMRALDIVQAFPLIIIGLTLVALAGNSVQNVVIAIIFVNLPRFMRLIRSESLSIRESRFIEAARSLGASPGRILFRHILPNMTPVLAAQSSLAAAEALLMIASLSFLGVGLPPPTPSWGGMIQAGAGQLANGFWWTIVFPGIALLLCIACFNLIADAIEKKGEVGAR